MKIFKRKTLILGLLCLFSLGLALLTSLVSKRQILRQKATGGTIEISLDPASGDIPLSEADKEISVYLKETAVSDQHIHAFDIQNIHFDTAYFSANTVACNSSYQATPDVGVTGDNVRLACFSVSGISLPLDTRVKVGTFKLHPLVAGTDKAVTISNALIPDASNNNLAGSVVNATFNITAVAGVTPTVTLTPVATLTPTATPTVTPTPTTTVSPTPSVTATPTPTGTPPPNTPVLAFKVKFQGVNQKPLDDKQYTQRVKVRVVKGDFEKIYNGVSVTSNDKGVFSGSVTLSEVPPDSGYTVFIKGPKHLARKFCVNNQAERCRGTGNITLATGNNNFDFSDVKVNLEAGDLPKDGVQDGVVNSVDYSLWKARIGQSLPEALAIADVNLDGVINVADWQLMRNTLETKYEEDN